MPILKTKAAREMSKDELGKKLSEIKLELAKELGKIRVGGIPESPGKIRAMRKAVAKILTIQGQKEKNAPETNAGKKK